MITEVWVIQNRGDETLLPPKFEPQPGFLAWPTELAARTALDEFYWLNRDEWAVARLGVFRPSLASLLAQYEKTN